AAVISPNAANHPEPVYLGGIWPARAGEGVHDDLEARAIAIAKGREHVVYVALDVTGFTLSRIRDIRDALGGFGLDPDRVLIASTHTHEAPDLVGVYGPNLLDSGVSPTYMRFIQDTVEQLVIDTWSRLEPVTLRAASAEANDPGSNEPTLIADIREPDVTVPTLSAASFVGATGDTVATLLNWHSHPEVMIGQNMVTADFPRWARTRLESRLGGVAVYATGAVGGLSTPTGVAVPARDENGDPVLDGGEPVYLQEPGWDKMRSLGFVIADVAANAIETAGDDANPDFSVRVEPLKIPVRNPIMMAAFVAGLVEYDWDDVVRGDRAFCGPLGCADERLALVRVGPVAMISSPGETFPETMIGRDASVVDFGEPWGETEFPAMDGFAHLSAAPVLMHLGLCGDAIGYMVPASDRHPAGHPDRYEEDLDFSLDTEQIYASAVRAILQ
ncbi:MAG: hypothetical protein KJ042_14460, partial [Deltaproteobacteria bacterium]|nr:hypothetical protein [Deltaproteobacteria bacterium]